MTDTAESGELGVRLGSAGAQLAGRARSASTWPGQRRVTALAQAQSDDIAARLEREGVRVLRGAGRLDGPTRVVGRAGRRRRRRRSRPTRCWSRPARTRGCCPTREPDGERILTWEQVYTLDELPEHLVVVGSGVTGAEFASAYTALGSEVTLVSSRDRVLPGEDADAAAVLEDVFRRRGHDGAVAGPGPSAVRRYGDRRRRHARRRPHGRGQPLPDGGRLDPEHRRARPRGGRRPARRRRVRRGRPGLAHVGAPASTRPATAPACSCSPRSRPCRAGSRCGTASATPSTPLNLRAVSSNVFTDPEIATVGWTENDMDDSGTHRRR